jgi:hypothetical protein
VETLFKETALKKKTFESSKKGDTFFVNMNSPLTRKKMVLNEISNLNGNGDEKSISSVITQ